LEQDRGWQPGVKARLLYDHLARIAGPPRRLTSNGRKLAADAGCAYSLVVKYLGELEEAGWLQRVRHKHGDTEYVLTRPELANATPEQAASMRACNPPSSTVMVPSTPATDAPADPQHSPASSASSVPPAGQSEGSMDKVQSSDFSINSSEEMNFEESPSLQSSLEKVQSSDLGIKNELSTSQSSELSIRAPESGLKVQSSEFKVQSSANAYVPPVRTVLIKQQHALLAAKMNFEPQRDVPLSGAESSEPPTNEGGAADTLTDAQKVQLKVIAAQFHKRLLQLLSEYNINGRKRTELAAQICKLVADNLHPERYEQVLADVKAGLEQAKKRQAAGLVTNAEAVGVRILMDYVATGQLTLFDVPPPVAKQGGKRGGRGRTFRREQVPPHRGPQTEIDAMRRNAEQARLRGEHDKAARWLENAAKLEAQLATQHTNPQSTIRDERSQPQALPDQP
jgi:hypothetical protein